MQYKCQWTCQYKNNKIKEKEKWLTCNIRMIKHETWNTQSYTTGHFTFWISLSLSPKTETKRLSFSLSPMLSLTNHSHASSLTSSAIHRWFRRISLFIYELANNELIFVHRNINSNWLTYLVHAKSIFSDRSVQSLVSANRWAISWDQTKKTTSLFGSYLWSQSEFRTQR